ncbi:lysozyme inhibitor LprI family protein [Ruegeria marina]|uniref:Uncharacterized conserved protein YecT, DUF1311 family n=1 Tax=Ruegeria marina TaxID=639004 RepID=A0A1G6NCW2_9RHOB|nr:lysozyme inhibitor LprI family protein [Ruegeria marina]SDC65156.1 Uncharacterized conserved protein YecT, DUF1311 family [Ruegeria marina]
MKHLVFVIAFGLSPAQVLADPALECSDAGSQVEISACVSAMGEKVDTALSIALEIARESARELDEVTGRDVALPSLETAQSAWENYRTAHCVAVGAGFGGGSGTGIAMSSCRIELGRVRVDQLIGMAR